EPRRNQAVDTSELDAGAVVVKLKIKVIESRTCDELEVAMTLDRVLKVRGRNTGSNAVVSVGWRLSKCYWNICRRVIKRQLDRRRHVIEKACLPNPVVTLPAIFKSAQQCMLQSKGACLIDQIRLVEKILSLGRIIVGGQSHERPGSVDGTGDGALGETIIVAEKSSIPH